MKTETRPNTSTNYLKKTKNNHIATALTILLITIIIIMTLIAAQAATALTIQPIQDYNISEGQTITIQIQVTENTGELSFQRTPEKGTLTKTDQTKATFEWTPTQTESGTYNFIFTATDTNETTTETSKIIVTNTNNPITITEKPNPGTINTNTLRIEITTNKEALCKYSLSDKTYSQMEYTFTQTNSEKTMHKGTTPSLGQGTHTTYIMCEDSNGNYMTQKETITFEINSKPTASIKLSPEPPLKTERVKVYLTASEDLLDSPELKYYFDDEPTPKQITLIGTGKNWEGYLIIRETERERVGAFTFKGTDTTNIVGTEITSGQLFIVDDKKPEAVSSIEITNQEDSIRLDWKYLDSERDNIKKYNIYKKKGAGGTDLVDFHATTQKEYYIDEEVEYNKAYYYKVTAIDDAGNEGDLSKEIFITFIPFTEDEEETQIPRTETKPKLKDKLLLQLDQQLGIVDKTLLDLEETEKKMGRASGTDKLDAIETLGLIQKIKIQKSKVNEIRKGLDNLRNYDLSEEEFDKRTKEMLQESIQAWKETPTDITTIDSSTYQEQSDDQKTRQALEAWVYKNSPENAQNKIQELKEKTAKLQDSVKIEATIINSEIKYADETKKAITVRKTISSDQPINKADIIEHLPGFLAEKISDIYFSENPEKISEEPEKYVQWKTELLGTKTIKYSIIKDLSLTEVKGTKTTIIQEPEKKDTGNELTGFASKTETTKTKSPLIFPIIAGILVTAVLAGYYFFSSEERNIDKEGKISRGLINIKGSISRTKPLIVAKLPQKDDSHRKLSYEHLSSKEDKPIKYQEYLIKHEEKQQPYEYHEDIKETNEEADEGIYQEKSREKHKEKQEIETNPIQKEIDAEKETDELEHLYHKIKRYKENAENLEEKSLNIEQLQNIKLQTAKMRKLLDDIEEKNIEAYTERAKKMLGEALKYMLKQEEKSRISEKENKQTQHSESIKEKICPPGKEFKFRSGETARSLEELKYILDMIDDQTYKHHANEHKNDFAAWTKDVFKMPDLANTLTSCKNSQEAIKAINGGV